MVFRINPKHYKWFNPKGEQAFLLKDGRRKIGCSYVTLVTCARTGRRAPNGKDVQLRVCQIPGGLATTLEEFERFVAAISNDEYED